MLACAAPASAAVSLAPVGSFERPVHVAAPPEDHSRLMVVEQRGTIRVVRGGRTLPQPFLDITDRVSSGGERGLLSMAFAPSYATTGLFYVYYTDDQGDIRIEEYGSRGGADTADPSSARTLLDIPHRGASNHNGGQLQFGPDDLLYAGTGDGGLGNDAFRNAQNRATLLGKLLRISPRPAGAAAYGIPRDNPFVSAAGVRPEIWSLGLRNPFRFSFDRATGDLTIGDVGQSAVEEVDFVPRSAGGGRGANFGWPVFEGNIYRSAYGAAPPGNVRPVLERLHGSSGICALTGGYVVRDPSLPSLLGRYVYGDNCAPPLRSARLGVPRAADDREVGLNVPGLSSFGEDASGCVYVASLDGAVSRLVERTREVPCADRDAPTLLVTAAARQRALRGRAVAVRAACSEACTLRASGSIRIGRKRYRLRGARRTVARGVGAKLRLKLTRRTRTAVRRALRRKRRVRATIVVGAVDGSDHRARSKRVTVRIRR
jgi:glucose/arabinose dehydrogenase